MKSAYIVHALQFVIRDQSQWLLFVNWIHNWVELNMYVYDTTWLSVSVLTLSHLTERKYLKVSLKINCWKKKKLKYAPVPNLTWKNLTYHGKCALLCGCLRGERWSPSLANCHISGSSQCECLLFPMSDTWKAGRCYSDMTSSTNHGPEIRKNDLNNWKEREHKQTDIIFYQHHSVYFS